MTQIHNAAIFSPNALDMSKNRISYAITPRDIEEFKQGASLMLAVCRRMLEGTDPSDKTGQPMGDEGGWQYTQKCHEVVTAKVTEMFTAFEFNLQNYDRDVKLADTTFDFQDDLNQIQKSLALAIQLVGRDLMDQSNTVRSRLEILAKSHAEYQALFESVNFFYEDRGRKSGDAPKGGDLPK